MLMVMTRKPPSPPPTIAAGEFKAKCLELMVRVAATGEGIVITKRGRPVAKLISVVPPPTSAFGFAKGMVEYMGDVISPVSEPWTPDDAELARLSPRTPARRPRKRSK